MSKTRIEWTDKVWNPVTGCTKVSQGCRHCYAERMSKRLAGRCGYPAKDPFQVVMHWDRISEPLTWRKPAMIFACSMGDLFHDDVSYDFLDSVFSIILACAVFANREHTFMILTKRPENMLRYLASRTPTEHLQEWARVGDSWTATDDPDVCFNELVYARTVHDWDDNGLNSSGSEYRPWGYINSLWPLPNLMLGVSAENQRTADERIPILLDTPAAVRFVSCEPLLGPVLLSEYTHGLDWVIAGGESGPKAMPVHPDWIRELRDECNSRDVPFFFKQWGEWAPRAECDLSGVNDRTRVVIMNPGGHVMLRVGKKAAGRQIDGRTWEQFPQLRQGG